MPPKKPSVRVAVVEKLQRNQRKDIDRLEERTINLETTMEKIAGDVEILAKSTKSLSESVGNLCKTLDNCKWAAYGAIVVIMAQNLGVGEFFKAVFGIVK